MTIELRSPLTESDWDTITDVDFDNTDRIWFHTKHGKQVEFIKAKQVSSNADRIRSMTDEELSSWINDHVDCNRRCEALKDGRMNSDSTCMAAWLAWLKAEVKE